jgi:hypothetical protein
MKMINMAIFGVLLSGFFISNVAQAMGIMSEQERASLYQFVTAPESGFFSEALLAEITNPYSESAIGRFIRAALNNYNPNVQVDPTLYFRYFRPQEPSQEQERESWWYRAGAAPYRGARAVARRGWAGTRAIARGARGSVERLYRAGTQLRPSALWESGIGEICAQFVEDVRPLLLKRLQRPQELTREQDLKFTHLSKNYDNFLIQLLQLAQQNDKTCWNDTIRFVKSSMSKPEQAHIFKFMMKSALLQYAKLVRSYQLARKTLNETPGMVALARQYSARLINILRDPVALYFVGAAARALHEVDHLAYFEFAGAEGAMESTKRNSELNNTLKGYFGFDNGPEGQSAEAFVNEQANRIRFAAESTWFQRNKWYVYAATATASAIAGYLIWQGYNDIRSEVGTTEGFWRKLGVGIATTAGIVTRGFAQIGKAGYKQLEAGAGVIKTKAGEYYAKLPDVRGRFARWQLERKQQQVQQQPGPSWFSRAKSWFGKKPAGDMAPGTDVIAPAGNVDPNAPVITEAGNVAPDTPVEPVVPPVESPVVEERFPRDPQTGY